MRNHGPPPGLAGVAVLIVEDDATNAKLLSVVLQTEGCDTRIARDAEEALSAMEAFKPRAIILDLVLPRMSGLLFAQKLKSDPATREIVIIAVSAFNGPDAVRVAHAIGCVAYLQKPIDTIALPHLLLSHLGGTP